MYVVYTNQTILWRVRSIRTYLSAHVRAFFYVLFKCFHFSPLLISSFSFLKDFPPIRSSSASFILSSSILLNWSEFGVLLASSFKKSSSSLSILTRCYIQRLFFISRHLFFIQQLWFFTTCIKFD